MKERHNLLRQTDADYAELIAGIWRGDPSAVTNFRNTFTRGIQFFIAHELNETDVLALMEEVVMSVIGDIKEGRMTGANFPSQVLHSVRRNIRVRDLSRRSFQHDVKNQSITEAPQLVEYLLKAIPDREREALKRYYVDLETENAICAELDLTVDQFRNSQNRCRTQFMKAAKSWRAI